MKFDFYMKRETVAVPTVMVILFVLFFLLGRAELLYAGPQHPLSIISLPENENAILVEKKTQMLFVYSEQGEKLTIKFKAPCSTGEVAGVKKESGDKKTPEGVYFLKDEYEDKYLTPIYGKKAFPTDYPNFIDKREGKNGFAIWIHGTNKILKPMDSNGCVALENENILKLADYVTLDSTPVIMVHEIKHESMTKVLGHKKSLVQMLNKWSVALENGTYHQYLSCYAPSYLPRMQWWKEWDQIRQKLKKMNLSSGLRIDNVGIYFHDNIFVILFDLFFSLDDKESSLCKRKLFISYQDGQYKIVGDQFQVAEKRQQNTVNAMVVAAQALITPAFKNKKVMYTVNQWLTAWSSKDMDKYSSFYSEDFISDGMGKANWVKRKRVLAQKYSFINIGGKDFKLHFEDRACEVSFLQEYESSGYSTKGIKTLKLIDEGGLWKIYQETWKGN